MNTRELLRHRLPVAVYAICFSVGALSHLLDFMREGLRPYAWAPPPLEAFWTLLIVMDAGVAAILLTGHRRLGLVSAAALMVVDVTINTYAAETGLLRYGPAIVLQAAFLGFIAGSISFLWRSDENASR